jgi:hypothetical protein
LTSARAIAVRCCWPPESCNGVRFRYGSSFNSLAASCTRFSISARGLPCTRKGEAMFS